MRSTLAALVLAVVTALTVSCACRAKQAAPPAGPGSGSAVGDGSGSAVGDGSGSAVGDGSGSAVGDGSGSAPDTAQPGMGATCGAGDACATGLSCVTYYGIAGPKGPAFKSCEIKCGSDKDCPTGHHCTTISDGPGRVCR
jgi:hypothetical protein